MARILITGGTGFIGAHLAAACIDAGDEVHLLVRPGSRRDRLRELTGPYVLHELDMSRDGRLRWLLDYVPPDILYHLAVTPRRRGTPDLADVKAGIDEDLQFLISLLGAAATSRKPPSVMVRTGSLAEYGLAPLPYSESAREDPVTAYGAGLVAATRYIAAVQPRLPFPVITARLALVYGAGQSEDYLVPSLIARCLAGKPTLIRRPDDRRDLMHVSDAVDALRTMAHSSLEGGTILNVATGVAPTMREVARLIVRETCADPDLVTFGEKLPPSGACDLRGAPDRMLKQVGWRTRVQLAEGIARTVPWYRAHQANISRAASARPIMEDHAYG